MVKISGLLHSSVNDRVVYGVEILGGEAVADVENLDQIFNVQQMRLLDCGGMARAPSRSDQMAGDAMARRDADHLRVDRAAFVHRKGTARVEATAVGGSSSAGGRPGMLTRSVRSSSLGSD